jgi:hypothetical protein
MEKVVVVGMIYKSPMYLDFMMQGIKRYCSSLPGFVVDHLIVSNNSSNVILNKLKSDGIKHVVYKDSKPDNYYMNRIYRAWNFGGRKAEGNILVFINSDMAFSPNWLESLLVYLDRNTIPCSRLIESGKLLSGMHAVSKNFGKNVNVFNENAFLEFAEEISVKKIEQGGLFMPCAFYKDDFVNSGGYPEGNIYSGGIGAFGTKFLQSGDNYFFSSNPIMKVKKHITVFNSIVYHIQEGELDE